MKPSTTPAWKLIPTLLLASLLTTSCARTPDSPAPAAAVSPATSTILPASTRGSTYANVHCGIRDKVGKLWFGTTSEGVYRYDGEAMTAYTEKDGLCSNCVYSVLEDRSGNIWFGTDAGACRYDGKAFTPLTLPEPNGRQTAVMSIFQDKAGVLWFGTGGSGVYRYDGKVATSLFADAANPKRLKLNDVQQVIEDRTGAIWLASWIQEGACRFDGKTLTNITAADGLTDGMVHSLLQDKAGDIWIGTRDRGVCRYDGKTFKHVTGIEGFSTSCVYSMLEDKAGHLWFATEKNGVWRYDGKNYMNLTTKNGLGNDSVFCIVEDAAEHLWFGTRNIGLSRYDGTSFTQHPIGRK